MILTEFNEEEYREIIKQEAREEGLEEGRAESLAILAKNLMRRDSHLTEEEAKAKAAQLLSE